MSNSSSRLDYVTCALCGKSVEYRIYNKHWAQSRGHRTAERPYLPKIHRTVSQEDIVDSLPLPLDHSDTVTFDDHNTIETVGTPSDPEPEVARIPGAGIKTCNEG